MNPKVATACRIHKPGPLATSVDRPQAANDLVSGTDMQRFMIALQLATVLPSVASHATVSSVLSCNRP